MENKKKEGIKIAIYDILGHGVQFDVDCIMNLMIADKHILAKQRVINLKTRLVAMETLIDELIHDTKKTIKYKPAKISDFSNGDLKFDIEKILNIDCEIEVNRDLINEGVDGEESYYLDICDNSYHYANQLDRDKDYQLFIGFLKANDKKFVTK